MNSMESSLLKKQGLCTFIAGSEYDFRMQTIGEKVTVSVEKALKACQMEPKEIYSGQQVHGVHVAYADGKNGESFLYGKQFSKTDGLITDKPGITLLIKFGDCTPVVLYDPVKKVQAVVHSGWRSTVGRISLCAIERMEREFGCDRRNIFAYIGPSIDQAHYEVGPEVYEAFQDFSSREDFFQPHNGKYLMSMTDANLSILTEAGIPLQQIEVEKKSTYLDPQLHSARREGSDYQLNAMLTMIPEE